VLFNLLQLLGESVVAPRILPATQGDRGPAMWSRMALPGEKINYLL
jgi:hypothetical protein